MVIVLRYKVARIARRLRLLRVTEAVAPPDPEPWYLRQPLSYSEHFTRCEDVVPVDAAVTPEYPEYEDVFLSYACWMDNAKRAALVEVAMTEPDPVKAAQAVSELRRMCLMGRMN